MLPNIPSKPMVNSIFSAADVGATVVAATLDLTGRHDDLTEQVKKFCKML